MLAKELFPGWVPGSPCCSPLRGDPTPSFTVSDDGHRWHDAATGEHGDALSFLAMAVAISTEEACRRLIELAAIGTLEGTKRARGSALDHEGPSDETSWY
jgi:DNA primase